ncbi:MAG: GH116 family glycosyl hydrolase [Candidatus Omnitrophota bacterium]
MPLYNSQQKVQSGMPLGGIGAGKFEITPYGTIDYITYQNNWSRPIANQSNKAQGKALGITGFHFALYVNTQAAAICKLLQTEPISAYNTIQAIDFFGKFPLARLVYKDDNLPVDISLTVYSHLIPGDIKNSSLPGAVFEFDLSNKLDKNIEVAIMFIGRNLVSRNSVGRINNFKQEHDLAGLEFTHTKPLSHDEQAGDTFICLPKDIGKISFLSGWNMQKENFIFEPKVGLDALDYFSSHGRLPNIKMKEPTQSQSIELGGALAVSFNLAARQNKKVPFIYSWHFPQHFQGHVYEKYFKKSRDVAVYINRNKDELFKKTACLPNILERMGLEDWLSDALLNNLYTLFSSSWLTRKADFTMYEAPIICPLMGTLDVYFYASTAIGLLFPSLDKKALSLFKQHIRKSGYVPHDIGLERIDLPSNGTTMVLWKDLNPKFILSCYRAFCETKDLKFLKEVYPVMKKAFEYSLKLDKDGDGLPDNEGFDTTFDTWGFKGASAYNGGVFLVSLLALRRVAEQFNDKKLAKRCIDLFSKGRKSFEQKLWNGKYYITAKSAEQSYESCILGQLTGQWYAYLLGLGRIFPEENIKSAIKWILKLNEKDSKYGATNSVFMDKKRDLESYHSQNIWPGVCYSFAALAIYEGFVKEGLKLTKKVWNTISVKNKNPWNQSDVIIAKDGSYGFGDYYMRNSVIWAVLIALAENNPAVASGIAEIRKMVQSSEPKG